MTIGTFVKHWLSYVLLYDSHTVVQSFLFVGEKPAGFTPTDNVMSLEDTFGYISSKTGRIWTKRGRGMRNGEIKSDPINFFGEIAPEAPEKEAKYQPFFRDEYHAVTHPFRLITYSAYRFPRNLAGMRESFRSEILKFSR